MIQVLAGTKKKRCGRTVRNEDEIMSFVQTCAPKNTAHEIGENDMARWKPSKKSEAPSQEVGL